MKSLPQSSDDLSNQNWSSDVDSSNIPAFGINQLTIIKSMQAAFLSIYHLHPPLSSRSLCLFEGFACLRVLA